MTVRPQSFPSRQYAYARGDDAADAPAVALDAGAVYRFVMGRDPAPRKLTDDDVQSLHDPFARLVLRRGRSPRTLNELLRALSDADGEADGLPGQRVFLVADGGQIAWSPETAGVKRGFRFLVTRGRTDDQPALYVSTTAPFDSELAFLQVVGWDSAAGAYQFYDRRQRAWIWAGSSWDALAPDSRGQGPFDSHVNGALNMKELKAPWVHWHSMAAGIRDEVLPPGDPLVSEPLWLAREGAERLETEVVRPGIQRWNDARFAACRRDGRLTRLPELLRQVLETTTVNLVSSPVESHELALGRRVRLPLGFFIDSDALVDELGLDPGLAAPPEIDGAVYLECLRRYDVGITDGERRFPGDTHFAFVVPERAFEDLLVLRSLRAAGVLPDKLAAALLMVDFSNPLFSRRRASLLHHVPESAATGPASDFPARFLAAVEAAAAGLPPESPEQELLDFWRLPEGAWRGHAEARLAAFFAALAPRLADAAGFAPLFELAESRRREFRRRPLAEFRLTTPVTNIPEDAPLLELLPDGSVRPKA
jgi:hypothetical protein